MDIKRFCDVLKQHGIRRGAGVPCSFFTPLVNYVAADPELDYVSATNEGEAVSIAAGLVTAGHPAFALMQNSGLGNAVNPITSMLYIYGIPVVLLVSHRGEPGKPDEPQHALMGEITEQLAILCRLRTHVLDPMAFEITLREAQAAGVPAAWICRKDTLTGGPKAAPVNLVVESRPITVGGHGRHPATVTREEALDAILPLLNGSGDPDRTPAVVSTTGRLSRELYELDDTNHDKSNRFYMVGSMGCAASFGIGVALGRPDRPTVVLDGDGALLMKLGSLATAGHLGLSNLHHIVFDNGAHDSTGGQPTPSPAVDFAVVAAACGYRDTTTVHTTGALRDELERQLATPGPSLIRMVIRPGTRSNLGRPTLTPRDGWLRFRSFLGADSTQAVGTR